MNHTHLSSSSQTVSFEAPSIACSTSLAWPSRTSRGSSAFGAVLAAALVLGACQKDEEIQYPPPPPQPPPVADAGAPPATDAAADAAPQGAEAPLDPTTISILQTDLSTRAKTEAKGMTPASELFGAAVEEGGAAKIDVTLDVGKCYAVLGTGGPGVEELDLQIMAKAAVNLPVGPVLAVDNTTGSKATISPCWKNAFPLPVPAVVSVQAKRGAGAVGAQVFVK